MKKGIPEIREREGNEEKNIPKIRERESKATIPGNGTEKLRWLELIENVVKCSENKGRVPEKNGKIVLFWQTGGE